MRRLFEQGLKEAYFLRGMQISFAFTFSMFFQQLLRYPYSAYTSFTLMMIYLGFDAGAVKKRALNRFWGGCLAIMFGFVVWYMGHFNFRAIYIMIIIWVYGYVFFSSANYRAPTFFTMGITLLGTGYLDTQGAVSATELLIDVFISTIFGLAIIFVLQEYIFSKDKLAIEFLYLKIESYCGSLKKCCIELPSRSQASFHWQIEFDNALQTFLKLKRYVVDNEELLVEQGVSQILLHQVLELSERAYVIISMMLAMHQSYIELAPLPTIPFSELEDLMSTLPRVRRSSFA